jgi:hypothetical protein
MMTSKAYQPKTGARCGCKRGVMRDNCPNCEGTGWVVDFAAIRARKSTPPAWEQFTKRTNEPKLSWLEGQLTAHGIPHRRNGESFHAPILEVPPDHLPAAWAILTPVDDVPDDDPRFM